MYCYLDGLLTPSLHLSRADSWTPRGVYHQCLCMSVQLSMALPLSLPPAGVSTGGVDYSQLGGVGPYVVTLRELVGLPLRAPYLFAQYGYENTTTWTCNTLHCQQACSRGSMETSLALPYRLCDHVYECTKKCLLNKGGLSVCFISDDVLILVP